MSLQIGGCYSITAIPVDVQDVWRLPRYRVSKVTPYASRYHCRLGFIARIQWLRLINGYCRRAVNASFEFPDAVSLCYAMNLTTLSSQSLSSLKRTFPIYYHLYKKELECIIINYYKYEITQRTAINCCLVVVIIKFR